MVTLLMNGVGITKEASFSTICYVGIVRHGTNVLAVGCRNRSACRQGLVQSRDQLVDLGGRCVMHEGHP